MANRELKKACTWFEANKLTLNVSKTKFILFRKKSMKVDFKDLSLKIGNEEIERIGSNCKTKFFKLVGIHLDEHLSWDFQINHVCSKLSSGNFAISRAKHFVPRHVRMSMYNSFFKCYCDFGILAWGGVKPSKIHKIVQLQKKCIRNVAGKGHRTHADPLFSAFRALKFEDMFKYSCATFMHKCVQSRVPSSFHGFLNALPPH